jgi:hypothetical protein
VTDEEKGLTSESDEVMVVVHEQLPPAHVPVPPQAAPSFPALQDVVLSIGWQIWHGSLGFVAPLATGLPSMTQSPGMDESGWPASTLPLLDAVPLLDPEDDPLPDAVLPLLEPEDDPLLDVVPLLEPEDDPLLDAAPLLEPDSMEASSVGPASLARTGLPMPTSAPHEAGESTAPIARPSRPSCLAEPDTPTIVSLTPALLAGRVATRVTGSTTPWDRSR